MILGEPLKRWIPDVTTGMGPNVELADVAME